LFSNVFPTTTSRRLAFFNESRNSLLAQEALLAGTSQARRTGLRGVSIFEHGRGLWIVPSEAIHTFGLKLPIDSIFLDKELRVRGLHPNLKPCRIAVCLRAHSVLELPAGTIERSGTKIGDRLRVQ
jgi:uncharacterized membrane protein (UPF0127 family)